MCIVSMVHDYYEPLFPTPQRVGPISIESLEFVELRNLIEEFRELVASAKRIDAVTGQPDCVDPEKAKLEERVTALEKLLLDRIGPNA